MKVLHLLSSDKYSGAENVVCQIIDMFKGEYEMTYCSLDGPIRNTLSDKKINFLPLKELSLKEIKAAVKKFQPDVIHAHDIKASILASRFHKQCNIISHVHGNDKRNMGKVSLKSLLFNLCSNRFKKIFWVSNSCLTDYRFKNRVKDKSIVLHNIINVGNLYNTAKLDNNKYDFDVCYLGRLTEVKNPLRALEIMRDVVAQNKSMKCAVVGDGDLREECENFVRDNGLDNNIKLFGFVKNPYKVLESSKVLLMSSINEGTPMALLEAFALGVPLVSTKIDGAVELITNELMGGFYEDNATAVKLINSILNSNRSEIKNYLINFSNDYNNIEKYKNVILSAYTNDGE